VGRPRARHARVAAIAPLVAIGSWLSPVVLAVLAARAVAGDPQFPLLAASIASAAVVGLLAPPASARPLAPVAALALLAALMLVLAAELVVMADLARSLGLTRFHGLVAAAVLALGVAAVPFGDRWWRLAAPVGALVVLVPLALVIASVGPPWIVWRDVASRPALTFDEHSAWVTHGRALPEGTRLTFDEPHRVTAATAATWRVVERDPVGRGDAQPVRIVVREWRLNPGDALTVRPGDQLSVEPEARVRFEAGRRVPGAPASGISWADGGRRRIRDILVAVGGTAVTLVGGGLALVAPAPMRGATVAIALTPALIVAFVLGATLWGLYGIALAPELSLVPRALAPVLEVVQRVDTPSWRAALAGLVTTALVVLFLGVVFAWRVRAGATLAGLAVAFRRPSMSTAATAGGTAAVVVLAAAVAWMRGDPWQLFTWGLGLAASAVVAPRLAAAGPRAELVGMAVGTGAFAAAALWIPHPALVAAPLAWLAGSCTWGERDASPKPPYAPGVGEAAARHERR